MAELAVDLLGPLRLVVDGVEVGVRGPKRRAVLALLALAEGRVVTVDRLLDALWPTDPPESAQAALHSHVFRLRAQLGPGAEQLERVDRGYRLRLSDGGCDVTRARTGLARARRLPAAEALAELRAVRGLWRGPVLADLTDVEPVASAVVALEQLHRTVTDELVQAGIDAGVPDGLVDLAAEAVAQDPLREPAVLLFMRALAAAGRAPEALRAGREYRRRLADEEGLDPSPALGELEQAVAAGEIGPKAVRQPVVRAAAPGLSRLVGRDEDLARVRALLRDERLVTIVGPGGVGKTRLAAELAGSAARSVTVPLAPVTAPGSVPHVLAAALDLQAKRGDVVAACAALLAAEPALLVLDNGEHLLDALRDLVATLLVACPRLTVLTTSREPLGLPVEAVYRLAPLPVPSPSTGASTGPAVDVFLDRARRVRPGWEPAPQDVAVLGEITRRLDGMPLAIELAAGRLSTFALTELRDRLDRSLDLLAGGRPSGDARHRTLRDTVGWSYALLPSEEQVLFRHLAVFPDGVDLPVAEELAADLGLAVDPGGALAHLVDASVLVAAYEDGTRFRMLETLRAFGLDQLAAAGETEGAHERFVQWAVRLTAEIDAVAATESEPAADATLRRELRNLEAAWRLARDLGALDEAVAMVVSLVETLHWRDLVEPRAWAEELLVDPAVAAHPRHPAVLGAAAEGAWSRGEYLRAEQLARAGLAGGPDAGAEWICLTVLSVAGKAATAYGEVIDHALAAAALGHRPAINFGVAGLAATFHGDLATARDLHRRTVETATSPSRRALAGYLAGEIDSAAGRIDAAEAHYLVAIELSRAAGSTFVTGLAAVGLQAARARAGRSAEALRGFREVIDYWAKAGNWTQLWVTLRNLADLLRGLDDPDAAALLDEAADCAPDAPPRPGHEPRAASPAPDRSGALATARRAIAAHLQSASGRPAAAH